MPKLRIRANRYERTNGLTLIKKSYAFINGIAMFK